jgi:hypothetical protein
MTGSNGELTTSRHHALWMLAQGEPRPIHLLDGENVLGLLTASSSTPRPYAYAYAFGDGLRNALYAVYEDMGEDFKDNTRDAWQQIKITTANSFSPRSVFDIRPSLWGQGVMH